MRLLASLVLVILSAGMACADLNHTLSDLRVAARADLSEFSVELGARFGLSRQEVEVLISAVDDPVDAALVLWLGEKSRQPQERVLEVYRQSRKKGWGAMAQRLGIKPGSPDFKALKAGELGFHPGGYAADTQTGPGKSHKKYKYKRK